MSRLDIVYTAVAFFLAAGVTYVSCRPVNRFAKMIGAIDVPKDDRRVHTHPVTRLGGLAIFIGFITAAVIFAMLSQHESNTQVRGILIGAVVIVILGVLDDILQLQAIVKLALQVVAASIPVFSGVTIDRFTNPFFAFTNSDSSLWKLGYLSIPITLIWIIVITNSVNLIDGLDGLAAGVSAIAAVCMLIISIALQNPLLAILMAALSGSCLGFLPFNFNPAKMFMGDTGALFLGYLLATSSILGLFKFYTIISFAVPFLVMGLPLFDAVFAIFRRVTHGKSPMSADRGHVHHRLIDMGFSQKQSVSILYVMSAALGLTAVVLTTVGEVRALILLVAILVAAIIAVNVFASRDK